MKNKYVLMSDKDLGELDTYSSLAMAHEDAAYRVTEGKAERISVYVLVEVVRPLGGAVAVDIEAGPRPDCPEQRGEFRGQARTRRQERRDACRGGEADTA